MFNLELRLICYEFCLVCIVSVVYVFVLLSVCCYYVYVFICFVHGYAIGALSDVMLSIIVEVFVEWHFPGGVHLHDGSFVLCCVQRGFLFHAYLFNVRSSCQFDLTVCA